MNYKVKQGESVASIAYNRGFLPETVWGCDENAKLRELRQHPECLAEGDELFIPEQTPKTVELSTGQVHTIERRAVPARLRVRFDVDGEPRANQVYSISIDGGEERNGETKADGLLDEPISPVAKLATVTFEDGERKRVYRIRLRTLDPSASVRGAQARLANSGYSVGKLDGVLGPRTRAGLRSAQRAAGLTISGELDDATQQALRDLAPG